MSTPKPRPLQEVITGRLLTGLFLEDACLHLRFTDAVLVIDLATRAHHFEPQREMWLSFPGWLRIARVLQDTDQVVLETTGAVYSSRISIRHAQGTWQIMFPTAVAG